MSDLDAAERLRLARERAGYDSARGAARAMGANEISYGQHESGLRGISLKSATRYAKFFRVTPEWLLMGRGDEPTQSPQGHIDLGQISRKVPILGSVQAGAWSEVLDYQTPDEYLPVLIPGLEHANLFALKVVGNSMNLHYPSNSLVIVCPAAEMGLRDGDHVVVRRTRGGLSETTIKEAVQKDDHIELWPRSTDPQFSTPQKIYSSPDADEGVEIIGVVVASYNVRTAQNRQLLKI